ncbi:MAG: hypothetical protein SFW35_05135 [Chitinophagales bacterium]|nr:hypothetical protein [Chitinophagales bacterium]
MSTHLHCIDLSDKLKCLNLCSTGTLSSLLTVQLFIDDKKPNPMYVDIEKLRSCSEEEINGLSSARMLFVFQRSVLKTYSRPLTENEEKQVRKGDLEIEFEGARRIYKPAAPSRLSCLYLVENNTDGRDTLGNMFRGAFKDPMIFEVSILNQLEVMRFDHNWVEIYYDDPQEGYLKSYWSGELYDSKNPSWEYLLEGTVQLTDLKQKKEIDTYVERKFPDDFKSILANRAH